MDSKSLPTVDPARHELARTANYEVQALALTLRKFIEANDPGAEIAVVSRGILTRISDLSEVVFDAVINDDDNRDDVATLVKKAGTDMDWLLQGANAS
jgi:hypothetical protein